MVNRLLFGLIIVCLLSVAVSAAPFTVKTTVNGKNPATETATVKAGEAAQVSVDINVNSDDVTVDSVEIDSTPAALGGVLEAFIEKRTEFPKKLDPVHDANSYELPGLVPGGDYEITALIHYSGAQSGTAKYTAKITVENDGLLSLILGLVLNIMPKFIVKPIVAAVL